MCGEAQRSATLFQSDAKSRSPSFNLWLSSPNCKYGDDAELSFDYSKMGHSNRHDVISTPQIHDRSPNAAVMNTPVVGNSPDDSELTQSRASPVPVPSDPIDVCSRPEGVAGPSSQTLTFRHGADNMQEKVTSSPVTDSLILTPTSCTLPAKVLASPRTLLLYEDIASGLGTPSFATSLDEPGLTSPSEVTLKNISKTLIEMHGISPSHSAIRKVSFSPSPSMKQQSMPPPETPPYRAARSMSFSSPRACKTKMKLQLATSELAPGRGNEGCEDIRNISQGGNESACHSVSHFIPINPGTDMSRSLTDSTLYSTNFEEQNEEGQASVESCNAALEDCQSSDSDSSDDVILCPSSVEKSGQAYYCSEIPSSGSGSTLATTNIYGATKQAASSYCASTVTNAVGQSLLPAPVQYAQANDSGECLPQYPSTTNASWYVNHDQIHHGNKIENNTGSGQNTDYFSKQQYNMSNVVGSTSQDVRSEYTPLIPDTFTDNSSYSFTGQMASPQKNTSGIYPDQSAYHHSRNTSIAAPGLNTSRGLAAHPPWQFDVSSHGEQASSSGMDPNMYNPYNSNRRDVIPTNNPQMLLMENQQNPSNSNWGASAIQDNSYNNSGYDQTRNYLMQPPAETPYNPRSNYETEHFPKTPPISNVSSWYGYQTPASVTTRYYTYASDPGLGTASQAVDNAITLSRNDSTQQWYSTNKNSPNGGNNASPSADMSPSNRNINGAKWPLMNSRDPFMCSPVVKAEMGSQLNCSQIQSADQHQETPQSQWLATNNQQRNPYQIFPYGSPHLPVTARDVMKARQQNTRSQRLPPMSLSRVNRGMPSSQFVEYYPALASISQDFDQEPEAPQSPATLSTPSRLLGEQTPYTPLYGGVQDYNWTPRLDHNSYDQSGPTKPEFGRANLSRPFSVSTPLASHPYTSLSNRGVPQTPVGYTANDTRKNRVMRPRSASTPSSSAVGWNNSDMAKITRSPLADAVGKQDISHKAPSNAGSTYSPTMETGFGENKLLELAAVAEAICNDVGENLAQKAERTPAATGTALSDHATDNLASLFSEEPGSVEFPDVCHGSIQTLPSASCSNNLPQLRTVSQPTETVRPEKPLVHRLSKANLEIDELSTYLMSSNPLVAQCLNFRRRSHPSENTESSTTDGNIEHANGALITNQCRSPSVLPPTVDATVKDALQVHHSQFLSFMQQKHETNVSIF